MNEFFADLWGNKILIATLTAWLIAQLSKSVLEVIINKKWDWKRFIIGAGGMPSSHSALVCAVAMAALLVYGVGSFEFVISLVFVFIVLHDARGVRLETGKQATILNHIMANFSEGESNIFADIQLKELVGHTTSQVVVGALIGIVTAIIIC